MFSSFRFYAAPHADTTARIEQHAKNHNLAAWALQAVGDPGLIWEIVGPSHIARPQVALLLQQLAEAGPDQRVFTVTEAPVAVAIVGAEGVQAEAPVVIGAKTGAPVEEPLPAGQRTLDGADLDALIEALSVATEATNPDSLNTSPPLVGPATRMRWGQLAARLVRPGARILTFTPKQTPAINVGTP